MKKNILLVVALIVALAAIAACAPAPAPAPVPTPKSTVAPTPAPIPAVTPATPTPLCEGLAKGQGLVILEQKFTYECGLDDKSQGEMVEVKGDYYQSPEGSQRIIFKYKEEDFFYGCEKSDASCIFTFEGVAVQAQMSAVILIKDKAGQVRLRMRVNKDGHLLVEEKK